MSSSFDKLSPEFRVVEDLSVGSLEEIIDVIRHICLRYFRKSSNNIEEDEGHKENEVGEFEVPLKKIEAQKAPQKRLRIPKKRIRQKSAVPRKWKQKQPPGLHSGSPTKRRRKLETKPSRIFSKKF